MTEIIPKKAKLRNNKSTTSRVEQYHKCDYCDRVLGSKGGKTNHMKKCSKRVFSQNQESDDTTPLKKTETETEENETLQPKPPDPPPTVDPANTLNFNWGSFDGDSFARKVGKSCV